MYKAEEAKNKSHKMKNIYERKLQKINEKTTLKNIKRFIKRINKDIKDAIKMGKTSVSLSRNTNCGYYPYLTYDGEMSKVENYYKSRGYGVNIGMYGEFINIDWDKFAEPLDKLY